MDIKRLRKRLVNFRLTDDELQKVEEACNSTGARSLSEFARSAILSPAEKVNLDEMVRVRLELFSQKLSEIEATLQLITRLLSHPEPLKLVAATVTQ